MGQIYIPTHETWPATADAVIIGGGIVGVATAFWLSQAGLDVITVEMRDGLSTLTTSQSIECFRAQFTEPAMADLALFSIDLFENFAEVVGLPGYDISIHHQGYLFVSDNPERLGELQAAVDMHKELGVSDSVFLSGDELRTLFPFLSEGASGATFRQKDGWLSSHKATQGFAKGSNARFLLSTTATGIKQDAKGLSGVETDRGTISTRIAVNAAGPYARIIGRMAGLDLPLEPVRRQKVFIAPRPEIPQDAPLCIDLEQDAYWRPEVGGAFIAWVDPDEPQGEPAEQIATDPYYAAIVLEKLMRLFPFWEKIASTLRKADVLPSAGQYVYTPDDQPLIGQVTDVPGLYLNCGYWAGVMLSPAAGKRVADLVTGRMNPQDNPLRPSRFKEGIVHRGNSFLRGRH